jgi:hypothetical protein
MVDPRQRRHWPLAGLAAIVLVLGAACAGDALESDAGSGPPAVSDGRQAGDDFAKGGGDEAETGSLAYDANAPIPGTASGGEQSSFPGILDRKIIMTATITLESDEVSKRFEDVGNLAASYGGFIASSSFGNSGDEQTASITIRVPAQSYQSVLSELRRFGDVKGEQSSASDVTEEYTDLDSRLRNLRGIEAQYLEFLTRAMTIDEILTVQDRLNATRLEIEQVQGRINLLDNQADLATITIHLEPPFVAKTEPKGDGTTNPVEALENGWEASLAVLTGVAAVALAVIAFSWWLVPVGVAGAYALRRFGKTVTGRTPPAPSPPSAAAT